MDEFCPFFVPPWVDKKGINARMKDATWEKFLGGSGQKSFVESGFYKLKKWIGKTPH